MHAQQIFHELRSTLSNARECGDLRGHLYAWLQTITTRKPIDTLSVPPPPTIKHKAIEPGDTVLVRSIPRENTQHRWQGRVVYPIRNFPNYWAISQPGKPNRSVHERDLVVV